MQIKTTFPEEQKILEDFAVECSVEQLRLNTELCEECQKDALDFAKIEFLLKKGADPLGCYIESSLSQKDTYTFEPGTVYGDLMWLVSDDPMQAQFPRLTQLFLQNGMDVDRPRIPYEYNGSTDRPHPLYDLAYFTNEYGAQTLKLLLDAGLSTSGFAWFLGHAIGDLLNVDCSSPNGDKDTEWTLKMLLLGASYPHVLEDLEDLEDSEHIKKDIRYQQNREEFNYDVKKFRNWENYEFYFDTSHCQSFPELYKSIIFVCEKSSGNVVWKFGFGLTEEEF